MDQMCTHLSELAFNYRKYSWALSLAFRVQMNSIVLISKRIEHIINVDLYNNLSFLKSSNEFE